MTCFPFVVPQCTDNEGTDTTAVIVGSTVAVTGLLVTASVVILFLVMRHRGGNSSLKVQKRYK